MQIQNMTICNILTQVKNLKQNTTHHLLVHIHYLIIFANNNYNIH